MVWQLDETEEALRPLLAILALLILGLILLFVSGVLDRSVSGAPSLEAQPSEDALGDDHRFDVDSGTLSEGLVPANEIDGP